MPRCIVAGCSSKQNKNTAMRGVILHVFPPNVDRIKTWLMHIGQDFGNLDDFAQRVLHSKKNGSFRLCSDHFTPQSYVEHASKKLLRVDAVPTIFDIKDAASLPFAKKSIPTSSGNNYSTVCMPSTGVISCATSNTFPSSKDVSTRTDSYSKTREASTQTNQNVISNTVKSPQSNTLSNIVTDPNKIDKIRKKLSERILQLTLEIIYLLTGEECTVVKKTPRNYVIPSSSVHVSGVWNRSQGPTAEPSPTSLTPEARYSKILEVTKKISQLLTGEVPIWCQDVTVSFSMEEDKNVEEHKDINKDVMMENQPPFTSPDGSRNNSESCPRPLLSTMEHQKVSSRQGENMVIIKVEVKEEPGDSKVTCGEPCREEEISTGVSTVTPRDIKMEKEEEKLVRVKEEEIPAEISTDHVGACRDIKVEENEEEIKVEENEEEIKAEENEEEINVKIKEEDVQMEINTDGTYNTMEMCHVGLTHDETDDSITDVSSDENPVASNRNPVLPDPPTHGGSFSDHSYPIPLRTDSRQVNLDQCPEKGKDPLTCSLCGKSFSDATVLRRHEKTHKREMLYTCLECGKMFLHNSRFIAHRRIHTGERPYSCSKCGKSFVNKPDLVRHLRTHTGEKPFPCTICGKRFTQKVHLVTHQKKHVLQKT